MLHDICIFISANIICVVCTYMGANIQFLNKMLSSCTYCLVCMLYCTHYQSTTVPIFGTFRVATFTENRQQQKQLCSSNSFWLQDAWILGPKNTSSPTWQLGCDVTASSPCCDTAINSLLLQHIFAVRCNVWWPKTPNQVGHIAEKNN